MPSQPSSRVLPGRPGGAAGTPSAHCACAAMLPSRARAFPSPASRGAGRWGKHRAQRACVNTRQTPRPWARESSPAAVRTGGGAGKPAQTGVVSAFEVAGEGARAGSSQGSRSGLCRSCGNPARCPQCGGDGGLGKPGGSAPAWSSASVAGVPS